MNPLDEVQGKVKELVGDVVHDEGLHAEGREQKEQAAAEREADEAKAATGADTGRTDVFERLDRERDGL